MNARKVEQQKKIRKIKRKLKFIYEYAENKFFKKNFLTALPFWVGAFITGIAAIFYTKLFLWAEMGTVYLFHHVNWIFFFVTPVLFIVSYWLVKKYSPFSSGSGIPQVIASIQLNNPKQTAKVDKLLGLRVILIKVLSSIVMVFGGGVVGKEGPIVQISASIFKKINDILPSWYPKISKKNMLVTGAAAGLASAFNTPLGGIVFAIEELTKTQFNFFKSALLTGVIIAGFTVLHFLGPYLYLGFPELDNFSFSVILVVIPVGIITGLAGSGMGKIILYILKWKKSLKGKYKVYIYIFFSGLILAAIAYFIDRRVMGSGKEIMVNTLFTKDKYLDWYMPFLRLAGPVLSYSTGAAGGIFAPSLSAGASIGSVIASLFHLSDKDTNLIILSGMVGVLTGITRSPFTSAILVIEMTNTHNVIIDLMLTALLANLVANIISKHSFYDVLKNQYIEEVENIEEPENKIKT